jgi:hypothetical protein
MARLHRPYIPLPVRVQVAHRQLGERYPIPKDWVPLHYASLKSYSARLDYLLRLLFESRPVALDHDPALVNRRRYVRRGKTVYEPPANDPYYLRYRPAGPVGGGSDHDIKTRVRGDGAELSDLAKARKAKRVRENRARGRGAAPLPQKRTSGPPAASGKGSKKGKTPGFCSRAARPLRSANRWPPRGSRKLNRRDS